MEQNDYLALLKQARANLPENVGNKERWALPRPDLIPEGRMTILRNFKEMTVATRREPDHVAKFLLSQIGTAGQVGQTVWARVNKLSGKMAFAELTTKPKE